jgi:hypothetical protein
LCQVPLLRPFILRISIQVFQQLAGINSTILTGVNGCANVVATVATIIFIDQLGRRILLITGAIIMSISMFIVAILIVNYGHKQFDSETGSFVYKLENVSFSWLVILFYPETKDLHLERNRTNDENQLFVPRWLEQKEGRENTFALPPIVNQINTA